MDADPKRASKPNAKLLASKIATLKSLHQLAHAELTPT
jgi:hypothetical protein